MNVCMVHAPGDKEFASALATQLHCQIDCSICRYEMSTGYSISDENYCREDIDAIVILLSEESSVSAWCRNMSEEQLHDFEDCGTAVINVMIEDCEIPEFAQRENISDFRGATPEETSAIGSHILWISSWTIGIAAHYQQAIMSGKSPEDCRPQRIGRPARLRLERNDFFNTLLFQMR